MFNPATEPTTRGWVRTHRVRALLEMTGEAGEIASLEERRRHLACGLARVVGAAATVLVTDDDFAPGHRGRVSAYAGDGPVQRILGMHLTHPNEFSPDLRGLVTACDGNRDRPCVRRRDELASDEVWYGSDAYNDYLRPDGLDDTLCAAVPVSATSCDGAKLVRARGERPFDDEDCALLELYLCAFAALWRPRNPPAAPGERALSGWADALPPRLRRVLDLAVTGLSEKEIADRAGLTYSSTHQYMVELYRRAGVSSRAQLMARLFSPGPTVL